MTHLPETGGNAVQGNTDPAKGVLLLSMRRVAQLVAYCVEYEFEDVVKDLTAADRIDLDGELLPNFPRRLYKYARFLTGSRSVARVASIAQPKLRLERDY